MVKGMSINNIFKNFTGDNIENVHKEIKEYFASKGGPFRALNIFTHVKNPEKICPEGCKEKEDEMEVTLNNLINIDKKRKGFVFNHMNRINNFHNSNVNQLEKASKFLKYNRDTLAIIQVFDPIEDITIEKESPPPAFCMARFSKKGNELGIIGIYRVQEMSHWWVVNIWELMHYQKLMIDLLRKEEMNETIKGPISTFSITGYWWPEVALSYLSDFDDVEEQKKLESDLYKLILKADSNVIDGIKKKIENKIKTLSLSNLPTQGFKTLSNILNSLEEYIKTEDEKNRSIHLRLKELTEKNLKLHEEGKTNYSRKEEHEFLETLRIACKEFIKYLEELKEKLKNEDQ